MASTWETLANLSAGQVVTEEHMDDIRININKLGGHKINGAAISTLDDAIDLVGKWGARAYNSGTISHTTSGAWQLMTMDAETGMWDTDTIHDTSSNPGRFTAARAGIYLAQGCLSWANNGTGLRGIRVQVNGTTWGEHYYVAGSGITGCIAVLVKMTAAQYVTFDGFQSSGASLNMANNGNFGISGSLQWVGVSS